VQDVNKEMKMTDEAQCELDELKAESKEALEDKITIRRDEFNEGVKDLREEMKDDIKDLRADARAELREAIDELKASWSK